MSLELGKLEFEGKEGRGTSKVAASEIAAFPHLYLLLSLPSFVHSTTDSFDLNGKKLF